MEGCRGEQRVEEARYRPDHEREVRVEFARDHFICRFGDGVSDFGVQTIANVHNRRSFLQNTQSLPIPKQN